jgi:hypothetical protein
MDFIENLILSSTFKSFFMYNQPEEESFIVGENKPERSVLDEKTKN